MYLVFCYYLPINVFYLIVRWISACSNRGRNVRRRIVQRRNGGTETYPTLYLVILITSKLFHYFLKHALRIVMSLCAHNHSKHTHFLMVYWQRKLGCIFVKNIVRKLINLEYHVEIMNLVWRFTHVLTAIIETGKLNKIFCSDVILIPILSQMIVVEHDSPKEELINFMKERGYGLYKSKNGDYVFINEKFIKLHSINPNRKNKRKRYLKKTTAN